MKKSKWLDFIFTVVVRLICGIILGCLAGLIAISRYKLWAILGDNTRGPLIVVALFALGGGIVAVFTTPYWQTPWYKGIRGRDGDKD